MQLGTKTTSVINEMVQRIVGSVQPVKIILFGSYARGTAGPDSDVDLMVVVKKTMSKRKMTVGIYKLLAGMGLPKDIVVVTLEEIEKYATIAGTLIKPALREGKVLYEQKG